MARTPVHIKLDPNRCDRCGRCTRVCEPGALKVAPTYIYLDWRTCDECMKCVDACEQGAIQQLTGSRKKPAARPRTRGGSERVARAVPVARAVSVERGVWTLPEAAAVLLVAFTALFANEAFLGNTLVTEMSDSARVMARVVVLSVFYAIQFALLAWLAHRRDTSLPGVFGLTRVRARVSSWASAAGWVALLLVTTRLAAWVWGVASRAVGFDPPSVVDGGFTQVFGAGLPGLVLSVALVVLVAPVAEEMVFRGVLLGAIGARWGARAGLLGSGVLFALYHLTPWQIVPVFILGVACGWLTQHRGSLWPAIALHVLYNAVPVGLAFLATAR